MRLYTSYYGKTVNLSETENIDLPASEGYLIYSVRPSVYLSVRLSVCLSIYSAYNYITIFYLSITF